MAKGKNYVSIIGFMAADPELVYLPKGTAKVTMRVGIPYDSNGNDTQWENTRVVAYGKAAEILGQYTWKGRNVGFDGRLQTRSWKDSDGNQRWTTEIVVREFYLFGPAKDNGEVSEGKADVPTVDDTPFEDE